MSNHSYANLLADLQILDPKGKILWETKIYIPILDKTWCTYRMKYYGIISIERVIYSYTV